MALKRGRTSGTTSARCCESTLRRVPGGSTVYVVRFGQSNACPYRSSRACSSLPAGSVNAREANAKRMRPPAKSTTRSKPPASRARCTPSGFCSGTRGRSRGVQPAEPRTQAEAAGFVRSFAGQRLIFTQRARLRRRRVGTRVGERVPRVAVLAVLAVGLGAPRNVAGQRRRQNAGVGARLGQAGILASCFACGRRKRCAARLSASAVMNARAIMADARARSGRYSGRG